MCGRDCMDSWFAPGECPGGVSPEGERVMRRSEGMNERWLFM